MSQFYINGIVAAGIYVVIAAGFALIFSMVRFFHFAHGIVFTAGAYFTLVLSRWLVLPLCLSVPFAILLSALLGCLMEWSVYGPLRRREASPMVLLLASLGMYIVLQNTVSMVFGDDTKTLRLGIVREGLLVFGARITPVQIAIIVTSLVLVTGLWLFLRYSKMGRAVASDPKLAAVCGIDADRVIIWAFAIGSALAGVAGILVALDVDMTPTMGMQPMLMGIVAVIVGGNTFSGAIWGSLFVGMSRNLGVIWLPTQWQDAIVFLILILFLLFRPQGILGDPVRKAAV